MSPTLLNQFIQWLIGIVNGLITIILAPIALLIEAAIPSLDNLFTSVGGFISYALTYVGWVINALGIPPIVIGAIALYYIFIVSTSISAYGIKLGLKWWEALKP